MDSRSIKSINTARALEEEEEACPSLLGAASFQPVE